jgi:hypothetical protein
MKIREAQCSEREMDLKHTCEILGEACKVTRKWVANVCEKNMKMDPRTSVDT